MKHFLTTSDFAKWAEISRDHVYTIEYQQGFIVRNHENMIELEQSVINLCTHYEGKYDENSWHRAIAARLRAKLEAFNGTPKKIYVNTNGAMDKMGFSTLNQFHALKKRDPTFPEGVMTRARSGGQDCLYAVDELDAYFEKNWKKLKITGRKMLSNYWAKQFIRGEFAPVRA